MAKMEMFGIPIDVPDREKRKYRKHKKRRGSKALSSPEKDKMMRAGGTTPFETK